MHDDIIEHVSRDAGYNEGYINGKKFAQDKVLGLMEEVIHEYRSLARLEKMDSEESRLPKAQLNAVEFMKSWIISGGHEDFDGNRACLPW
jgi:hypothetical protein